MRVLVVWLIFLGPQWPYFTGRFDSLSKLHFSNWWHLGPHIQYLVSPIALKHSARRNESFALLDRKPQIPSSAPHPQQQDEGNNHYRQVTADNKTANGSHDVEQASKWSGRLQGSIAMEHVTFTYTSRPDVPVLQDLSLEIGQSQTTAIVGPSGAGKSTVTALLERFYNVQKGCIRLDGRDVRDLILKTLRRQIDLVQQEPTLFGLSVRDNITYGVHLHAVVATTDDQIWEACRKANAADLIANFPQGLDELIGERGTKLSGGPKQRIAIACAILLNPAILLLDEGIVSCACRVRSIVLWDHRAMAIQGFVGSTGGGGD